jgi:hypothetical protein
VLRRSVSSWYVDLGAGVSAGGALAFNSGITFGAISMPMLGIASQQGYNLGTTILAYIYKVLSLDMSGILMMIIVWRFYCFTETTSGKCLEGLSISNESSANFGNGKP